MNSPLYSLYKKCIMFILVILVLTNTAPTYAATKLHPNNTTEKIIFSIYRSSSQKILQDKILFYKWKLSMTSDTKQREKIQNILSAFQKIETYKYGNIETYANKKPATLTKNPESTQKSPIQQSNTTTTTSPISVNNTPQT